MKALELKFYANVNNCQTVLPKNWYMKQFYGRIAFFIQFNVPFKIILLIETSQSVGGRNGSSPGKPPDPPASRTKLVSHWASAGLEPTPDTAVR